MVETYDENLLEQIKLYNKQDCISLLELRNWLDNLIVNFNILKKISRRYS